MPTDDIKMFDQMKLATLIGMFAGQDSQRHTLEVSLGAIRAWHSEAERLRAENARLREAVRDAHALIDNNLVGPWIMAHRLDEVLSYQQQGGDNGIA